VVDKSGNVTIFAGGAGVGKSSLLLYLVSHHGYRFIADDCVILSLEGECLTFPKHGISMKRGDYGSLPSLFQQFEPSKRDELIHKSKRVIAENIPFVELFEKISYSDSLVGKFVRMFSTRRYMEVSIEKVYGLENIVDRGQLKQIVYIQKQSKSTTQIESLSADSMCRRVVSCLLYDWMVGMGSFLGMCMFDKEDLLSYFRSSNTILSMGIREKLCWLLTIPDGTPPEDMYEKIKEIL